MAHRYNPNPNFYQDNTTWSGNNDDSSTKRRKHDYYTSSYSSPPSTPSPPRQGYHKKSDNMKEYINFYELEDFPTLKKDVNVLHKKVDHVYDATNKMDKTLEFLTNKSRQTYFVVKNNWEQTGVKLASIQAKLQSQTDKNKTENDAIQTKLQDIFSWIFHQDQTILYLVNQNQLLQKQLNERDDLKLKYRNECVLLAEAQAKKQKDLSDDFEKMVPLRHNKALNEEIHTPERIDDDDDEEL